MSKGLSAFSQANSSDLVERQRLVLQGQFNSLYFSKFVNYLLKHGIVLVGTNISRDEYFVCAKKDVIYFEAERLAISKFNYRTHRHEIFLTKLVDEYDVNYSPGHIHENLEDVFTESEILYLIDTHLRNIPIDREMQRSLPFSRRFEKIIIYFRRKGIINQIYPLHNYHKVQEMWEKNKTNFLYPRGNDLCNYFGEEVAFFFEWFSFYWLWMIFPASMGVFVYVFSAFRGYYRVRVDRNPYVPLYAATIIIWGFMFIKFWKRRQSQLAYHWDTIDRIKHSGIRPEFNGTLVYNEVTNTSDLYFSHNSRKRRYVFSAFVLLIMLSIGFFFTICSMNLRGFVSETTHGGYNNFLYIPSLKKYSERNAIFDPHGNYFFVPVIMHTSFVYIMNTIIFKKIALRLTDYENHKTDDDYLYHLILKRFIFDSIDSYSALFYLAFIELDSGKLRAVLHSLFISDAMRHLILKCFVPWVNLKVKYGTDRFLVKTHPSRMTVDTFWNSVMTHDSYMNVYDPFDDYLELIIEYGYISLFATVSPMPAIILLIVNLIELKTDCFKLLFLFKRPRIYRANGTGPWLFIMIFLAWLSVITNIFLFGITSNQLMQWFPKWYGSVSVKMRHKYDQDEEITKHAIQSGYGQTVIGFLCFIEHLFFAIGLLIDYAINSQTKVVRKMMRDEQYLMSRVYIQTLEQKKND